MYSQGDEEAFILDYFYGKRPGRFLEIGAYDPFKCSNTRALVERGWGGVYVEPSSPCMASFEAEYGTNQDIQLIGVCVGERDGTTTFLDSNSDANSTMFESEAKVCTERLGSQFERVEKTVVTVQTLLGMCEPARFDFLTIDTEGNCLEILQQFDFAQIGCQLVCVEWAGRDIEAYRSYFAKAGFEKIFQNGESLIYGLPRQTFAQVAPASETLVSVLVPVHNSSRYLKETIDSLRAQTYKDIEIVLVDDGSKDDSLQILEWFAARDARIVVLPRFEKNLGVVEARNTLLYNARGAYIAWNDSDDVSKPDRIEKQVAFLRDNPQFGAVGTGIVYADEKLAPVSAEDYPADPERQAVDPYLCCATLMARRQAAGDAGRFRRVFSIGGEDGDWLLKMADRHKITNIPDHLYIYRRHQSSLTHNRTHTAGVVRLGMFARAAARVRRQGKDDPVNLLVVPRLLEQLGSRELLRNTDFSTDEIVTALSRAMVGDAPTLSIGHVLLPEGDWLRRLIGSYSEQTFQSFEVLLAVPGSKAESIKAIVEKYGDMVRVVQFDGAPERAWSALIEAARGSYFVFAPAWSKLPKWRVHLTARTVISHRGGAALLRRRRNWRFQAVGPSNSIERKDLEQGTWIGLVVERDRALALLGTGSGELPVAYVEYDFYNHNVITWLFRHIAMARRIQRQAGLWKLAEAIAHRVLLPRFAATVIGRRIVASSALSRMRAALASTFGVGAPGRVRFPIDYKAAEAQAVLKVAVYESWNDFEESLYYATPQHSGLWGGVMFAPADRLQKPDFALILNTPAQPKITVDLPASRIWFAVGEPPTQTHRMIHEGQGEGTVVLTCDPELGRLTGGRSRYEYTPVATRTWHVKRSIDDLANAPAPDKPKRLSWITSNTAALEGHRKRLAFLEVLKAHVDFDLYGRGFTPVDDKWDAIAPYRYSIAFENTVAPLYFTEKIMDCFVCMTVPFYYGSPDITKYFPARALITIDPDDPKVLDRIRDISASEDWKERQDALAEARHLVLNTYNIYARLSKAMLKEAAGAPQPPVRLEIVRKVAL